MAESENTSPRLAELRQRWEENRGSRVFLQLAEEHRRHGQNAEAAAVIEEGLERRPNDVAARVALSRCRLDLDEVDAALQSLEQVIQQDPAHIVASKLLVDAYLRAGDADKARERLGIYRLLNDRDPELDHFEYRLGQLDPADAGVDPEAETGPLAALTEEQYAPESGVANGVDAGQDTADDGTTSHGTEDHGIANHGSTVPAAEDTRRARLASPFDLGAPLPETDDPVFAPVRRQVSPPVASPSPAPRARASRVDPFGALTSPPEPVDAVWSSGPFLGFSSLDGVAALATVAVDAVSSSSGEKTAEIPMIVDSDVAASAPSYEAAPDSESVSAPASVEEADLSAEAVEQEVEVDDERSDAARIEERVETAEETPVDDDSLPATVAMADIYAEQGHRDEAIATLERVLALDPDDADAQARLEALNESARPESTAPETEAADPVEGDPVDGDPVDGDPVDIAAVGFEVADDAADEIAEAAEVSPMAAEDAVETGDVPVSDNASLTAAVLLDGEAPPAGLTARKVHLLERYLSTIRRGRARQSSETGRVS